MNSTGQYSEVDPSTAHDRRQLPRLAADQLQVYIRQRHSFRRKRTTAVDFNRYGIAVMSPLPYRVDAPLVVELCHPRVLSDVKVAGVVHNCLQLEQGFRCGIRFRLQSRFQFDTEQIETYLRALEAELSGKAPSSA